jgi:hypothetical protein
VQSTDITCFGRNILRRHNRRRKASRTPRAANLDARRWEEKATLLLKLPECFQTTASLKMAPPIKKLIVLTDLVCKLCAGNVIIINIDVSGGVKMYQKRRFKNEGQILS